MLWMAPRLDDRRAILDSADHWQWHLPKLYMLVRRVQTCWSSTLRRSSFYRNLSLMPTEMELHVIKGTCRESSRSSLGWPQSVQSVALLSPSAPTRPTPSCTQYSVHVPSQLQASARKQCLRPPSLFIRYFVLSFVMAQPQSQTPPKPKKKCAGCGKDVSNLKQHVYTNRHLGWVPADIRRQHGYTKVKLQNGRVRYDAKKQPDGDIPRVDREYQRLQLHLQQPGPVHELIQQATVLDFSHLSSASSSPFPQEYRDLQVGALSDSFHYTMGGEMSDTVNLEDSNLEEISWFPSSEPPFPLTITDLRGEEHVLKNQTWVTCIAVVQVQVELLLGLQGTPFHLTLNSQPLSRCMAGSPLKLRTLGDIKQELTGSQFCLRLEHGGLIGGMQAAVQQTSSSRASGARSSITPLPHSASPRPGDAEMAAALAEREKEMAFYLYHSRMLYGLTRIKGPDSKTAYERAVEAKDFTFLTFIERLEKKVVYPKPPRYRSNTTQSPLDAGTLVTAGPSSLPSPALSSQSFAVGTAAAQSVALQGSASVARLQQGLEAMDLRTTVESASSNSGTNVPSAVRRTFTGQQLYHAVWNVSLFLHVMQLVQEQLDLLCRGWELVSRLLILTGVAELQQRTVPQVNSQVRLLQSLSEQRASLLRANDTEVAPDATEESINGRIAEMADRLAALLRMMEQSRGSLKTMDADVKRAVDGARFASVWWKVGTALAAIGAGAAVVAFSPVALSAIAVGAAVSGAVLTVEALGAAVVAGAAAAWIYSRVKQHLESVRQALQHGTLASINLVSLSYHNMGLSTAQLREVETLQAELAQLISRDAECNRDLDATLLQMQRRLPPS